MLGLFLGVFSFFISIYFVGRYLDASGIEKSFLRGTLIFAIALAIACVVGYGVNQLTAPPEAETGKVEGGRSEPETPAKAETQKPEKQ